LKVSQANSNVGGQQKSARPIFETSQPSCKQKTQHTYNSKHPKIKAWEVKKIEIFDKEVKIQLDFD
jgi:hypothetical protein